MPWHILRHDQTSQSMLCALSLASEWCSFGSPWIQRIWSRCSSTSPPTLEAAGSMHCSFTCTCLQTTLHFSDLDLVLSLLLSAPNRRPSSRVSLHSVFGCVGR